MHDLDVLLTLDSTANGDDKRRLAQIDRLLRLPERCLRLLANRGRIHPGFHSLEGDYVKRGWLAKIRSDAEIQALSARELLDRFKRETVFWRQFELGQALAATGNRAARIGDALLRGVEIGDFHGAHERIRALLWCRGHGGTLKKSATRSICVDTPVLACARYGSPAVRLARGVVL